MYPAHNRRKSRFTILDAILLIGIAGGVVYAYFRIKVGLAYTWRWEVIPQYLFRLDSETGRWVPNLLILGLLTTIRLSVWSSVLALILGTMMGILRLRPHLLPRLLSRGYVELVRNTPPLVLVFIFYFFLGNQITTLLGISEAVDNAGPGARSVIRFLFADPARFPEFISAVMTLALYEGAYITEIVRAGIQSVDKGQWEAAYSLGFSRNYQYRFIILPQAVRKILPALAGQFISAIKDSAIVSVISIQELTFQGLELMSSTYRTFEIWITITVLYFLLTATCSAIAHRIELGFAESR